MSKTCRYLLALSLAFVMVFSVLGATNATAVPLPSEAGQKTIEEYIKDNVGKTKDAVSGSLSPVGSGVANTTKVVGEGVKNSPEDLITSAITDAITDGFQSLVSPVFDGVMGFFTKPLSWLLSSLGKMWIEFTPVLPDSAMGSQVTGKTSMSFGAIAALVMVCSIMVGAVRIVLTQRGEPLRDIGRGLLTFAFMSSGWYAFCILGLAGTDALAKWIAGPVKADGLAKMVGYVATGNALGAGAPTGIISFGLLSFALVIFVLIISLILMFQLALRGGILLILAGMGPVAASFASTKLGWEWCQKIVAWTIGFMLFKPVGALIWSAALMLSNTPITDINNTTSVSAFALTPLALLLGCVFAMPALMKLVVPATAGALGSSDSSAGSIAAGVFGGAIAAGASLGQFTMLNRMIGSPDSGSSSSSSASGSNGSSGSRGAADATPAPNTSNASKAGDAGSASNAGTGSNAGKTGSAGNAGGVGAAGKSMGAGGGSGAGAGAGAAGGPAGMVVSAAASGAMKAGEKGAQLARSSAAGAVEYQ